jgi:hypothetical protein
MQPASEPVEQLTAPALPEPADWPQAVAQPVAAAAVQVPQPVEPVGARQAEQVSQGGEDTFT